MATMNEKDYYEILGVSKDATSRDIQKAFQQKARKLQDVYKRQTLASPRLRMALRCDASDRDDVVGVWWAPGLEWHGTNAKACGRGVQCPKPVCCRHI